MHRVQLYDLLLPLLLPHNHPDPPTLVPVAAGGAMGISIPDLVETDPVVSLATERATPGVTTATSANAPAGGDPLPSGDPLGKGPRSGEPLGEGPGGVVLCGECPGGVAPPRGELLSRGDLRPPMWICWMWLAPATGAPEPLLLRRA